jgi:propionyl-CoA carboxylase alpha chain
VLTTVPATTPESTRRNGARPPTNRDLLVSVLRHSVFTAGDADTSLLEDYDYAALVPEPGTCRIAAAAAAAAVAAANRRDAIVARTIPGGWRNVRSQPQITSFDGPRGKLEIRYRWTRTGIVICGPGDGVTASPSIEPGAGDELPVSSCSPDQVTLEVAGVRHRFDLTRAGDQIWVHSALGSVRLTLLERLPAPAAATESGSLVAPMPGSVTRIAAAAGDRVTAGQLVLVLEAMKMEHQVTAPAAGTLTELRVAKGAQVNAGDVLAIVLGADVALAGE